MNGKLVAELTFWKKELLRYHRWFAGELELYGTPCPPKGKYPDAVTAWRKEYQEPHYMEQLLLGRGDLDGLDVLEIGPGPVSGIGIFKGANVMAVDPLVDKYSEIGFNGGLDIIRGRAEHLRFENDMFDVVITINSLDHVDDIEKAAAEIMRVLRPGGKMAFAVDHHEPRECEPIELDDTLMEFLFPGIVKVRQVDERALWRNF